MSLVSEAALGFAFAGQPKAAVTTLVSLVRRCPQRLSQPRNDDLLEDQRIWPNSDLPPEVPALWINPCIFREIAFAEKQVFICDGNLRIEHSCDDQHRRHRLAEQSLVDQRHLW